eukprot:UN10345
MHKNCEQNSVRIYAQFFFKIQHFRIALDAHFSSSTIVFSSIVRCTTFSKDS